jgi:hypothetical protein
MSFPVRLCAGAAAIAISALGAVTLTAPAASAGNSVLWYPTNNIWTDPSALSECRALGQQEVASGNWDAFSCRVDTPVSPNAIQLWYGVWVGCPTCIAGGSKLLP